jgi:hypothetical protein
VLKLSQKVVVQGKNLTVIGVTPPDFFGMKVGEAADSLCRTLVEPQKEWSGHAAGLNP